MHVAIIGSGQLARMLALAGWRLGQRFTFFAEENENTSCVEGLGNLVQAPISVKDDTLSSAEALYRALGKPDVITVERESVDVDLLKSLQPFCLVGPNPNCVHIAQNRGREKSFANELGISTAPFALVSSEADLERAIGDIGYPCILKSCEDGYDGRGQWKFSQPEDLAEFIETEGVKTELILEGFVKFERELSIISVRSTSGECAFYPLTENVHSEGILVRSLAPAELDSQDLQQKAEKYAELMLNKLDYVGVFSIEFFSVGDELVVNEVAPRVHNSGHWTQAAGIASQFENHVRAITGLPLGETQPNTVTGMINLLGVSADKNEIHKGNVQLHEYNKELRPKRKVGHINVWSIDRRQVVKQLEQLEESLYSSPSS